MESCDGYGKYKPRYVYNNMDNLTIFSFFSKIIAIFHWLLYGAFMFGILFINAEAWFFGFKLSGESAQAIVLGIGISGLIIGYFIFTQKKKAYFGAVVVTKGKVKLLVSTTTIP